MEIQPPTTKQFRYNIAKMYVFKFLVSLHFIGGVLIPFFTDWGKINFTQIMLLQSWFMFCVFALEIPTGAIADFLGRKASLAMSALATMSAAIIYSTQPNFYLFLLGEFMFALAAALMSGADVAFTYDSLLQAGRESDSKKIFARLESLKLAGIMISAPLGGLVAVHFGLEVPIRLTAIPAVLAFFLALTFREPSVVAPSEIKRYVNIIKTGVRFFYQNKIMKILAFDMVSIATIGYFMIWLYQPLLKKAGIGLPYFGFVHAVFVLSQIILMNSYGRMEKALGSKKRVLFWSAFLTGALFIVGGLTAQPLLVLVSIIIGGGFALSRAPLFTSYLNKYIPSAQRATVISSVSMLRQIILVVVNPAVGYLTDWSLNFTVILLGALAIVFSFVSRVEEKYLIE